MKVNLIGITKRAKEKLKREGADGWQVIKEINNVGFSPESGTWLLLNKDDNLRWVKMIDDKEFRIV